MRLRDVAGYLLRADQVSIIMGAGASRSAGIPTAPLLVKQINKDFGHCLGGLSPTERSDYGRAMGALAPGDRKSLIQPLLDNSQINWGHVALACITKQIKIKRILTFNFDLILERAASLVGIHLPVYDFGVAPTRELAGLAAPAIFHLHGQSYGLRLMNSDAETAAHKEVLRPLLADSLRNHLTIVIGYSGEADAAFKVMEEEFNSHQNLIWLGFEAQPKPHLESLLARDYAFYRGDCDFDRTMIDLAEMLGCWPPEVIKNPPRHILMELGEVAKYPVGDETDLDILTSTRRRLEDAAIEWEGSKDGEAKAQEALMSGTAPESFDSSQAQSEDERAARFWALLKNGLDSMNSAKESSDRNKRTEKFKEAVTFFEAAAELQTQPLLHQPYLGLASALFLLSQEASGDERRELLERALRNVMTAEEIEPHNDAVLRHYGVILLGDKKPDGTVPRDRLQKASKKLAEMMSIDDSKPGNLYAHLSLLLTRSRGETGANRAKTLDLAENTIKRLMTINKEPYNYNYACILALKGLHEEAINELNGCLSTGKLPRKEVIEEDVDLMPLRDHAAFRSFLDRIPEVPATEQSL